MIITCEKCESRFNLDENLIKPSGSKVRCSVCKNVFFATRESQGGSSQEPQAAPQVAPPVEPAAVPADVQQAEPSTELSIDLDDSVGSDITIEPEPAQEKPSEPGADTETELSFGTEKEGSDKDFDDLDFDEMMQTQISPIDESDIAALDSDDGEFDLSDLENILEEDTTKKAADDEDDDEDLAFDLSEIEDMLETDGSGLDNSGSGDADIEAGDIFDIGEIEKVLEDDTSEIKPASANDDQDKELDLDLSLDSEDDLGDSLSLDSEDDLGDSLSLDEDEELADTSLSLDDDKAVGGIDMDLDFDETDELDLTGIEEMLETDDNLELETEQDLEIDLGDETSGSLDLDDSLSLEDSLTLGDTSELSHPDDIELEFELGDSQELDDVDLTDDLAGDFGDELDEELDEELTEEDILTEDDTIEEDIPDDDLVDIDSLAPEEDSTPRTLDFETTEEFSASSVDDTLTQGYDELLTDQLMTPQKKPIGKYIFGTFWMVLLLLAIAGIGGGGWLFLNEQEIPYVSSFLGARELPFEIIERNSKYIDNVSDSKNHKKLLVLTGTIRNDYPTRRSYLKVIGSLKDAGGRVIQSKVVFCGNVLSDEELTNSNLATIYKNLLNRNGINKMNVNVRPGGIVPFMIVFSDLKPGANEKNFVTMPYGSSDREIGGWGENVWIE